MIVAKPKWQLQKQQRRDTILQKKNNLHPITHHIKFNGILARILDGQQ
jgi:hypothetical protein